ncbi:alpha/beta hydrolase [Brevundimonas denitrificans]|uniref:alpha/beta hydrolase n=1 Tax=Brevundimonas denitrificans TaxID=1443434 RepID=UPI00223B621A|nr:alpha/beta hydrolase fold domain-containing protein [Brevundimonas denitrificans]
MRRRSRTPSPRHRRRRGLRSPRELVQPVGRHLRPQRDRGHPDPGPARAGHGQRRSGDLGAGRRLHVPVHEQRGLGGGSGPGGSGRGRLRAEVPRPPDAGGPGRIRAIGDRHVRRGRPTARKARWLSLADPVEDATAAFALVRSRADEWGVDPDRIGMVGFSAGAGTTLATTLTAPETRPAFIAPIYGAMTAVEVPETAPPMFVVLAADDPLFANSGFGLVESWRTAGRPVEFHLYQNGGHGFGLGNPGMTSLGWFDGFMRWLELNGFLQAGP